MQPTKSLEQSRVESLVKWASNQLIPGMDQDVYREIFEYVRLSQTATGAWQQSGTKWNIVLTAVVLRAFTHIGLLTDAEWPTDTGKGGMALAIKYLSTEVIGKEPGDIPEDIWDACQAALALLPYRSRDMNHLVEAINADWRALYDPPHDKNKWFGPAYLAAIIDVLVAYEETLGAGSHLSDALRAL